MKTTKIVFLIFALFCSFNFYIKATEAVFLIGVPTKTEAPDPIISNDCQMLTPCKPLGYQPQECVTKYKSGKLSHETTDVACNYICTEKDWNCTQWICSEDGVETRKCTRPNYTCETYYITGNGSEKQWMREPETKKACTPTCKQFAFSTWSACSLESRTRTRTIYSSYPNGCIGGNPVLEEPCEYKDLLLIDTSKQTENKTTEPTWKPECREYIYTNWSDCQTNGKRSRMITSIIPSKTCSNITPVLEESCIYKVCTDKDITCSDWSNCMSTGFQRRECYKNIPCTGVLNFPETTKACQYIKPIEKIKDAPVVKVIAKPKVIKQYAVLNGVYNIREKADIKSKVIGLTSRNTKYEILDFSNKDWVKVKFGNKTGWVFRKYVRIV